MGEFDENNVSKNKKYIKVMKVAHLIMAHKEPLQLERLLNKLAFPKFDLYIHLDKKVDIQPFYYLKNLFNVFFIENRISCNWGGFSFVRAITESAREILSKEMNYEFINLLSAQDYPIKSNDYIYNFLNVNRGKNFISYEEIGRSQWWEHAITRYEHYHFTDIKVIGKYRFQGIINRFLPKRVFPLPLKMYGSPNASWWMLTPDSLKYIINVIDQNKKLVSFMKLTWGADEFLFPTLIMNSEMRSVTINDNYRYIQWSSGRANPDVLSIKELNTVVNSLCLFARKFDHAVDTDILDAIDGHVEMN